MNLAQGNTRSLPDGFLHIQNFTVTKHAGVAGVVYTLILDQDQRDLVGQLLVERASQKTLESIYAGEPKEFYHCKHGTVRFRKEFLKENFREVVHAFTKITRQPVIQDFADKLIAERESLVY